MQLSCKHLLTGVFPPEVRTRLKLLFDLFIHLPIACLYCYHVALGEELPSSKGPFALRKHCVLLLKHRNYKTRNQFAGDTKVTKTVQGTSGRKLANIFGVSVGWVYRKQLKTIATYSQRSVNGFRRTLVLCADRPRQRRHSGRRNSSGA